MDDVVLPCENLDVEVVSDIVEEIADIEVIAEPIEDPIPDLDIQAEVEHTAPAGNPEEETGAGKQPEPDYDVEVTATVKDEEQQDIEVVSTVQDRPIAERAAADGPMEEVAGAPPKAPEPDYDVDVTVVVQDEELQDLEVVAALQDSAVTDQDPPNEQPDSAAGLSEEGAANPPSRQTPNFEVEVECQVIDAAEPDLEITCIVVDDPQEQQGGGESA